MHIIPRFSNALFVYQLVDGEYALNFFWGSDRIQSSIFSELNLTAEQVFRAGQKTLNL